MGNSSSSNSMSIELSSASSPSPGGLYYPGEVITGRIQLNLAEATFIEGMEVTLQGVEGGLYATFKIHLLWYCRPPICYAIPIPYVIVDRVNRVICNLRQTVATHHVQRIGVMPSGQHSFPFSFTLPSDCPPSVQFASHCNGFNCLIAYKLKCLCRVRGAFKRNLQRKVEITVLPVSPIPAPSATLPKDFTAEKCLTSGGVVKVNLKVESCVLTSGKSFVITGTISNNSTQRINYVELSLRRVIMLVAGHQNTQTKVISEVSLPEIRAGQRLSDLRVALPVPARNSLPSVSSEFIRVQYKLFVRGMIRGFFSEDWEMSTVVSVLEPPRKRPNEGVACARSQSIPSTASTATTASAVSESEELARLPAIAVGLTTPVATPELPRQQRKRLG